MSRARLLGGCARCISTVVHGTLRIQPHIYRNTLIFQNYMLNKLIIEIHGNVIKSNKLIHSFKKRNQYNIYKKMYPFSGGLFAKFHFFYLKRIHVLNFH